MKLAACTLFLGLGLVLAGSASAGNTTKINGDIIIAAGQQAGDVKAINGDIDIGVKADIREAKTINGSITLGENATAHSLKTVNGDVNVKSDTQVAGDVATVNGDIHLRKGAEVRGEVSNVRGLIKLDAARIGNGLETVVGDITVGAGSHVDGGIEVNRSHNSSRNPHTPRIVIGPHAVVNGTLEFHREVELYVSDSARIGPVKGAAARMFSGEQP